MVRVNDDLEIPDGELSFRFARSSGPGGQNVNKVATKVTLLFPLHESTALTEDQRRLIERRLANRISNDGTLSVTSERHRTRSANQKDAVARFVALVDDALTPPKRRKKTKVPPSEKRRRLEAKKRHASKKRLRGRPTAEE